MSKELFRYKEGSLPLPVFFPDATRAVVKTLDSSDIENTKTPGILVNTFHLWQGLNKNILENYGGIRGFMGWHGAVISDSGGFQVMSVIKKGIAPGRIMDEGIIFHPGKNRKVVFSPEDSVRFQMLLETDMVVVLDDFTDPKVDYKDAEESVERTISWAKRSKKEFEKVCKEKGFNDKTRPYLLGVVQGGEFMELREYCTKELVKIGFDGLGWGGWPFVDGKLNFKSAQIIAENSPKDYLLYGLGIGKPEDIITCFDLGYRVFDCVLPTRDARHGRLYVYNAESAAKVDIRKKDFYKLYNAEREKHLADSSKICNCCDCILCKNYSKGYLAHLFKIKDSVAGRLATIHNLRFYSILMERLQKELDRG